MLSKRTTYVDDVGRRRRYWMTGAYAFVSFHDVHHWWQEASKGWHLDKVDAFRGLTPLGGPTPSWSDGVKTRGLLQVDGIDQYLLATHASSV